jgi:oxepin-CoA hydrolase/3-oxo-5,6-dehydrosuberyl-CoA semialdehyde dehydrogenase
MSTVLRSYLSGEWRLGSGKGTELVNPSTEEVVASTSTEDLDLGGAVKFARERGGRSLRAITFGQRAELLKKLAKVLADAREELITLGLVNAGNTRSDAKFDIDGASATLMFYAELGSKLGDARVIADGDGIPIGRSARLYGQHLLVPRQGVAVHINAFNFPAWGMAEKLATALLAGMPVISKPATSTSMMAHRMAELWIESGALPEGAFSFVCGGIGDLLSFLGPQDAVAFTGSGATAAQIRRQENLARHNIHLNIEADSLNSFVLGPDLSLGTEAMNLFFSDVVKEMTQKAGQKCTAVRRIYVPADRLEEVREELVQRLSEVRVGNPADERAQMGPLATAQQLRDVRAGMAQLARSSQLATGGPKPVEALGVPSGKGFFVSPTLLVQPNPSLDDTANEVEVFGPVATLMAFRENAALIELVAAGGGGLVSSIYSDDRPFIEQVVTGIAPYHGRVTLAGEKLAGQSIPPGTVLPQLLHGGPGRAGGGEELGGMRGLSLYMQRVALQGHRPIVEQLSGTRRESGV